jgi:chromosome segregation ATPase
MVTYILNPVVFFSILAVLAVLSVLIAAILSRQNRDFSKLQDDLKRESTLSDELNKKVKDFAEKLVKVNSDLALRNQMYEGLVGQYNELEKDSEKLGLEVEELRKKQPPVLSPPKNNALA